MLELKPECVYTPSQEVMTTRLALMKTCPESWLHMLVEIGGTSQMLRDMVMWDT
jgi:hypothetical protein